MINVVDDDRFYIYSPLSSRLTVLLSPVILNEWRILNIHPSGLLTALLDCYKAGATRKKERRCLRRHVKKAINRPEVSR